MGAVASQIKLAKSYFRAVYSGQLAAGLTKADMSPECIWAS